MTAPLLEIRGVVAGYGKVEVLKDVSLSVAEGSITCLLGPNGAGKTTLMCALAGLLPVRCGSIRFAGADVTGRPPHDRVARGIALVPQNRLLFQSMTVHENLWTGAHGRRERDEIETDIEHLYERFPRLRERRHQRAGTLSGGEQQMLAIARALLSRPKLLLLDEPSLGLAPLVVDDVFRLIGDISAQGTTVFLVEQNVRKALRIAHRAYVLDRGRVAFGGDPAALDGDALYGRGNIHRESGAARLFQRM